MAYDLDAFCQDVRDIPGAGGGDEARGQIRQKLEDLLKDQAFVDAARGPDAEPGNHTLRHAPGLDFVVPPHVQARGRTSPPHDHGASRAICGQATEFNDMTEYGQNGGGGKDGCADIEIRRSYRLEPGDAGTFGPHRIRSIRFPENARFIRAAGTGLSRISTRKFDMAANMQPAPASAGPENNSTEKCPPRR